MRIGIDAQFLGPKHRGIGRYTKKLIDNLKKIDKKNQYIVFSGKESKGWRRQFVFPFKLKKKKT